MKKRKKIIFQIDINNVSSSLLWHFIWGYIGVCFDFTSGQECEIFGNRNFQGANLIFDYENCATNLSI